MRVRFKILIYKNSKRLTKLDLVNVKSPFWVGIRYILEFKYLEATKWLMIAEDCYEKYILLSLINLALGQDNQAEEFGREAVKYKPLHDIQIFVEISEKSLKFEIKNYADIVSIV